MLESTCKDFSLYRHQEEGIALMREMEEERGGGILADLMGLGKTITFAALCKLHKTKDPVLIVAPSSVLSVWKKEITRLDSFPVSGSESRVLTYHGAKRMEQLVSQTWDFVLTTYDIMAMDEFGGRKWGRIALDESHIIRNGLKRGKVPKRAKAAFDLTKHSKYRWCISGTPYNNSITDVAAQCMFLGIAPYNNPDWWEANAQYKKGLDEWRSKCMVRRTKEEAGKDTASISSMLPPTCHEISVEATACEKNELESLRNNAATIYMMWRRSKGLEKSELQAHLLALIQKQRVMADSIYCGDSEVSPDCVMRDCAKVNSIICKLDSCVVKDPRKGVVVFSAFTTFLDLLEKIIGEQMVGVDIYKFTGKTGHNQREKIVREFNESCRPRVILISLHAGGVGLSLHHGSSTLFLCEPYYNPYIEEQAAERVHRIGQKENVNIYRFSMDATVETWICGLKNKKLRGASILELSDCVGGDTGYFDDLPSLFGDLVAAKCADVNRFTRGYRPTTERRQSKAPLSKKFRKRLNKSSDEELDDVH